MKPKKLQMRCTFNTLANDQLAISISTKGSSSKPNLLKPINKESS